jgi:hypothetical protein
MLRRPKVQKADSTTISRMDSQTWQPQFRAGLTRLRLCARLGLRSFLAAKFRQFGTIWCDQSGVEFSAKCAAHPSLLSSQQGWPTLQGNMFASSNFTGKGLFAYI